MCMADADNNIVYENTTIYVVVKKEGRKKERKRDGERDSFVLKCMKKKRTSNHRTTPKEHQKSYIYT